MKIIRAEQITNDPVIMRDVYSSEMTRMASVDERVYALDADLANSIGMSSFQKQFPERLINCGIQEANMIGVAAGLSSTGLIPFAHTFAVFASRRVYDQVFLSCGFSKWNVKVVGSDPGISAAYNGGTHMPFEDLGIMRNIPGITIVEPTDSVMLGDLMEKIKDSYGLFYIRLTRKTAKKVYEQGSDFTIGRAIQLTEGKDLSIFASGYCVAEAVEASNVLKRAGISARVYDMFTIKPIDQEAVITAAQETGAVVTAENHNIINGLGSAVAEVLGEHSPVPMERVGVRDHYGEVGDVEFLAEKFGLKAVNIVEASKRVLNRK